MPSCGATLGLFGALLLSASGVAAGEPSGTLATPVKLEHLDASTFAEWFDGGEKPIRPVDGGDKSRLPQWLMFTDKTAPGHSGLKFGDSRSPGPRHLRIGFKEAVPVGSVLVRGGGQLSILRSDVAFPGDLANDDHWISAQRLSSAASLDKRSASSTLASGRCPRISRRGPCASPIARS